MNGGHRPFMVEQRDVFVCLRYYECLMTENNMGMVLTSAPEATVTPEREPDAPGCTEWTGAACGAGALTGVIRSSASSRMAYLDLVRSGLAVAAAGPVGVALAEPESECAERDSAAG